MHKKDFGSFIAKNHKISQVEAVRIIEIFTESVTQALKEKNNISLVGFGNFTVSDIPAKMGQNPRTGEKLEIKAHKRPQFKAGKGLKEAVN